MTHNREFSSSKTRFLVLGKCENAVLECFFLKSCMYGEALLVTLRDRARPHDNDFQSTALQKDEQFEGQRTNLHMKSHEIFW